MGTKKRIMIIAAVLLAVSAAIAAVFWAVHEGARPAFDEKDANGLIAQIYPMPSVSGCAGEKVQIKIYALDGCKITVRAGTQRCEAKPTGSKNAGCAEYAAEVKIPKNKIETESVGALAVTAVLGEKTAFADGPVLVFAEKQSVPVSGGQTESRTTLPAGNFEKPWEDSQTAPTVPQVNVQRPQSVPAAETENKPQGGNRRPIASGEMCVVSVPAADTWPVGTDSDEFVPYCTPLLRGTKDFVVSESEVFDAEGKKTRYFYELASGRRVQSETVTLCGNENPGDNEISAVSSDAANGDLVIRLKTKWYVPYSFEFSPQSYYSGHGKKYNVYSFTAQSVQFTFYHTVSAYGAVNTAGSVASGAAWNVNPQSKTASLTFSLNKRGGYYGYSMEYDGAGGITLTLHKKPDTLSGTVIVLDPGHGGKDPGALGFSGRVFESHLNFALAAETAKKLQARGATVYMTRYDDRNPSLEERKSFARSVKPDLFISIHANGSESSKDFGTSSFYFRPMSKPLAECVHGEMTELFKNDYYPGERVKIDRGCLFHPFSVARLEDCPSMLLEVGFITNETECAKMADPDLRDKTAEAILRGIEKYITSA